MEGFTKFWKDLRKKCKRAYKFYNLTLFMLFEIFDKTGRKIHLTEELWKHIMYEHTILSNRLNDLIDTLLNPLIIVSSSSDSKVRCYYKYYKNIRLNAKYLMVVVKYLNGSGFIITSFYTDKIKNEN